MAQALEFMHRKRVGVFFGGQSPEHEVSVISGLQTAAALDTDKFEVTPVYVSKSGRWFTGENLLDVKRYADLDAVIAGATEISLAPGPGTTLSLCSRSTKRFSTPKECHIDVAFLVFHGGAGENGAVQGLCESLGVPFTGSDLLSSALGMNKVRSKDICQASGIPVVKWTEVWESAWAGSEESELDRIEKEIGFPAIVKPVRLGSSIGIARVENREDLDGAIEEALRYDVSVLVEMLVSDLREINCSVLGNRDSCQVSLLEEPTSTGEVLSFQDKYMQSSASSKTSTTSGGAKFSEASGMASLSRLIPAPVTEEVATKISSMAKTIFKTLDCSGVVRIDFLMDRGSSEIWFNEINTIPGSLSFYLWEPTGLSFSELVERLISIAIDRFESRVRRVRTYDVNLLSERSARGLKGNKS